jgi:hypothetical protein
MRASSHARSRAFRARCVKTDWPSRIVQIVPALEKQIQGRLRSGKGMLAIA